MFRDLHRLPRQLLAELLGGVRITKMQKTSVAKDFKVTKGMQKLSLQPNYIRNKK